jgi:hypothetical protein
MLKAMDNFREGNYSDPDGALNAAIAEAVEDANEIVAAHQAKKPVKPGLPGTGTGGGNEPPKDPNDPQQRQDHLTNILRNAMQAG